MRMLHMSRRVRISFMYTYPVSTFTSIQHHQDACEWVCVCVCVYLCVCVCVCVCVCTPTVAPRSIPLLRLCSSMARCWSSAVMCCKKNKKKNLALSCAADDTQHTPLYRITYFSLLICTYHIAYIMLISKYTYVHRFEFYPTKTTHILATYIYINT